MTKAEGTRGAAALPYAFSNRCERLLEGFEPDFEFTPVDPLPESEYAERLRVIRREATVGNYDALVLHTDIIGWYHTSNSYLRYACDWFREGVLIIPTDADREMTLLSFWSSSVLLPPPGEPMLVDDVSGVLGANSAYGGRWQHHSQGGRGAGDVRRRGTTRNGGGAPWRADPGCQQRLIRRLYRARLFNFRRGSRHSVKLGSYARRFTAFDSTGIHPRRGPRASGTQTHARVSRYDWPERAAARAFDHHARHAGV